jgi:hypothetical protein
MGFPFQDELNETFRNDRNVGAKMAGAGLVTAIAVGFGMLKATGRGQGLNLSGPAMLGVTFAAAVFGSFLGLALSLKDTVEARLARGDQVNWLLKMLFGLGFVSLLIWMPILFFGAIFGVIVVAMLAAMAGR